MDTRSHAATLAAHSYNERAGDAALAVLEADEEDAEMREQIEYDELVGDVRQKAKHIVAIARDPEDLVTQVVDLVMSYETLADAAESRAEKFIRECQERTE